VTEFWRRLGRVLSSSKALFIDLDMTLIDTSQELIIAISNVWSEYGWNIDIDTDPRAFIKTYYKERLPSPSEPMARWYFWKAVWMKYLENRRYGRPMLCSDILLTASSGRYITAIVTGREVKAEMFMEELQSYGFPTRLIRVYSTGDLWPGATKRDLYEYLANIYEGGRCFQGGGGGYKRLAEGHKIY